MASLWKPHKHAADACARMYFCLWESYLTSESIRSPSLGRGGLRVDSTPVWNPRFRMFPVLRAANPSTSKHLVAR